MRGARIMVLLLLATGVVSSTAQAAFPGQNGKIAWQNARDSGASSEQEIYVMNPDGSAQRRLTDTSGSNGGAAWSPDGTQIAFSSGRDEGPGLYVMNADGSGQTRIAASGFPAWSPDGERLVVARVGGLFVMAADGSGEVQITTDGSDNEPSWSPDGTRILFTRVSEQVQFTRDLYTVRPDGSDVRRLTENSVQDLHPDWSPDGSRIAFGRDEEVFVMNPDGTEPVNLTNDPNALDEEPAWSPDGTKIAFSRLWTDPDSGIRGWDVAVMNADGTGRTDLTGHFFLDRRPSWQPVQPGYPRPKGATPFRASLVPAYTACTSPNSTHGPPLAFASCSPPNERSGVLTVGTPDANGAAAKMTGALTLSVAAGNSATPADEADVAISVSVTDVRCAHTNAACPAGAGSDYDGNLLALPVSTRITDRQNTPPGPSGVPGTGDTQFKMPVVCAPTADTTVGSTCSLATTADALMPGVIREGARAIWELGQLHVRDAGPNGTGYESPACPPDCGDGDETLFLRQGVFVP